jgi:hypothetical protein
MSKKIIPILAIIVALGIGFGSGMLVNSHSKGAHTKAGRHQHALAGNKGAASSGTVLSDSGSSLTIKLGNGSTETVYTSSTTSYSQVSQISSSSITNGATIRVTGTKNSDGSVTAKKITLE